MADGIRCADDEIALERNVPRRDAAHRGREKAVGIVPAHPGGKEADGS